MNILPTFLMGMAVALLIVIYHMYSLGVLIISAQSPHRTEIDPPYNQIIIGLAMAGSWDLANHLK